MKPRCRRPALVRHSLSLSVLIIILITSFCLSSCLPGMALADSSNGQPGPGGNGQNGGSGTFSPMPMFGSTFGGGDPSKPFTPIKSGIERFPSLGYSEASRPSDCLRYRYNSAPPTSGLYTRMYFDKNDVSGSVSPCECGPKHRHRGKCSASTVLTVPARSGLTIGAVCQSHSRKAGG